MCRESGDKLSGMLSEEHLVFHLQVGRLEHLQPNKVGYKLTRPVESLWLQGEAVVPSQRRTGRCLKAAAFGPGKSQTHRPPPVPKQNSANFIRGKNKRQLVWVPNQPPNLSNKQKNVGRILQNLSPPWREAPQRGHLRKRIPTTVTNSPVGTCRIVLSYLSVTNSFFIGMSQTAHNKVRHKLSRWNVSTCACARLALPYLSACYKILLHHLEQAL